MALMLVDGQRTIADLARLTRRQEQELYTVLAHLEALGLIVIRGW
jgi:predicted transcriptional regulator